MVARTSSALRLRRRCDRPMVTRSPASVRRKRGAVALRTKRIEGGRRGSRSSDGSAAEAAFGTPQGVSPSQLNHSSADLALMRELGEGLARPPVFPTAAPRRCVLIGLRLLLRYWRRPQRHPVVVVAPSSCGRGSPSLPGWRCRASFANPLGLLGRANVAMKGLSLRVTHAPPTPCPNGVGGSFNS